MAMKPTIKMIAEKSGVSTGTVDRVVNNRKNVKPEVRQRVFDVMNQLNYQPNKAARALAFNGKSKKIAVILPNWTEGDFKAEVNRGIKQACAEFDDFGLEVIVEQYNKDVPDECISKINSAMENGAEGIALCAKNTIVIREKINELADANIPVVTFNSDIPDSKRVCYVGQNLVKSGRIAAEIMSKMVMDHQKILIITGNLEFEAHKNRVDGFTARLEEVGITGDRYKVVECYSDYHITYEKVLDSIKNDTDIRGIYMGTESVAGCVEAIKRVQLGYKIRLIVNDVTEESKKLMHEGIVDFAIDQNMYLQGYKPVVYLSEYILYGKEMKKPYRYTSIDVITAENI